MNLLAGHVGKRGEESRSWEGVQVPRKKKQQQVGGVNVKGEEGFLIRQKS